MCDTSLFCLLISPAEGYRAVICGMDPVCCESKSWMVTANVEKLSKGPNQPFYQVNDASSLSCSSVSTVPSKSQFFFLVASARYILVLILSSLELRLCYMDVILAQ